VICLPRKPVDHVVEHRITFGKKERELLDSALVGYQFNRIGTPIVSLLSDVSAMTFLISSYAVWKYGDQASDFFSEGYEETKDVFRDFRNVVLALPAIRDVPNLFQSVEGLFSDFQRSSNPYAGVDPFASQDASQRAGDHHRQSGGGRYNT